MDTWFLRDGVTAERYAILYGGIFHNDLGCRGVVDNMDDPWIIDFGASELVATGQDIQKLYDRDMSLYFSDNQEFLEDHNLAHIIPPEYIQQ